MILGFDIGNTDTVAGLYRPDDALPFRTVRFPTDRGVQPDDVRAAVAPIVGDSTIRGMVFSSVVREVENSYRRCAEQFFGIIPIVVDYQATLDISINYDDPAELGPDRIVNAQAAWIAYRRDCIIVDLGTAVTFCVLRDGVFDGGLIAPGMGTAMDALSRRASRLMAVSLEKPPSIVMRNTLGAIRSGLYYGWLSMLEGIVLRIRQQYDAPLLVILTGGHAALFSGDISLSDVVIDRDLTMKGLKLIYDLNAR